ncbi:MAG: sigma 54-interacting transcriptional regulator [Firmicutes bacterium]|jgi:PAS domain S-box-containing protein|nr:sigma 54-interacting transcriptional regulator [Bacillota bacterium]MDH7496059.1 sigma 54-interacting transcriptional regulator [Bacillota bacterium]
MPDIALIAPYDNLATVAQDVLRSIGKPVRVERALLGDAPEVARRLKKEGVQVLISRGGTALILQDARDLGLPVVEIRVTAYDVVRAVARAKCFGRHIGIVGFENMVLGASTLSDAMDVDIKEFLLERALDADRMVRTAIDDGVDVLIGGVITVRTAERHGAKAVLIESGPEAVRQAIDEALRVLWVKKHEMARTEQFKLIVDNVSDGIISVDAAGHITVFNEAAERLTGLSVADAMGRHVSEVLPGVDFAGVLATASQRQSGHREHPAGSRPRPAAPEVCRVNGTLVSVTRVAIIVDGLCVGAIGTFQDIGRLQALEKDLRKRLYARGHVARFTFGDVVGGSSAIQATVAKAKRFASVDSTVLILGETGTGKELFAQSIHNASARRDGPFVAVNCAALPESLLESELFGYVEGAFTGAKREGKQGLFELAHHGTIFLDEIGGMPLRLQVRLLRVLQEREVMRLGDDRTIPVDVRIIAASNKDLRKLVAEGVFQPDLYYRLDVLKLVVPPLRDRREDIPLLANAFAKTLSRKLGKAFQGFANEALSLLSAHAWPGNVRELKNAVEKCLVLSDDGIITPSHVLDALGEDSVSSTGGLDDPTQLRADLQSLVKAAEREGIARAIRECHGNRSEAARRLGIDRTTLWRKLRNDTASQHHSARRDSSPGS